ncbi:MAG: exodeoxyribonuclease VII large subunit [Verrucomicrobiota bacterium]
MSKMQSQWDFGELFAQPKPPSPPPPPAAARRVLSVSELTNAVKRLLEQQVGRVWVTGELTNLRLQSSGHFYFAIKDAGAQLSCVLFRSEARAFNRDLLRDGLRVNLCGDLTVYEARGQYQLIVTAVELQGVGALQQAFEKLKQKLQAEGLFASARKRPLPRFPRRVGIVTSPTGAAIRDVVQAIRRRHPGLVLLLASCRVQGQGAADEVAGAIRLLNEWTWSARGRSQPVDLILLTRGGGSLEDLWAFNEEVVARAIFDSRIPVVSAIGHEIDFTISDFVADFRAATPTAAAEIITEGFYSSRPLVAKLLTGLRQLLREGVDGKRKDVAFLSQRLQRQHPRRWLQEQWQRLDDLQTGLLRCARYGHRARVQEWQSCAQRLLRARPSRALSRKRERMESLRTRLAESLQAQLLQWRQRLVHASSRLRLLGPQNVLDRGYSITLDAATGRVIRSARDVQDGQVLRTRLQEGAITTHVHGEPK